MLFAVRPGLITSPGTVMMTADRGTFCPVLVGHRHCADAGGGQCRTDLEAEDWRSIRRRARVQTGTAS
jgi:hypothetical protein